MVALSHPRARLHGRDGELLPARRYCLNPSCLPGGGRALLSAHADPGDRFCIVCAPRVDDEPPRDPTLYCPAGHLRAEHERVVTDRSRKNGEKRECAECKRLRDAGRDRSRSAIEARQLDRGPGRAA